MVPGALRRLAPGRGTAPVRGSRAHLLRSADPRRAPLRPAAASSCRFPAGRPARRSARPPGAKRARRVRPHDPRTARRRPAWSLCAPRHAVRSSALVPTPRSARRAASRRCAVRSDIPTSRAASATDAPVASRSRSRSDSPVLCSSRVTAGARLRSTPALARSSTTRRRAAPVSDTAAMMEAPETSACNARPAVSSSEMVPTHTTRAAASPARWQSRRRRWIPRRAPRAADARILRCRRTRWNPATQPACREDPGPAIGPP